LQQLGIGISSTRWKCGGAQISGNALAAGGQTRSVNEIGPTASKGRGILLLLRQDGMQRFVALKWQVPGGGPFGYLILRLSLSTSIPYPSAQMDASSAPARELEGNH